MPLPIKPINDKPEDKSVHMDYSFLSHMNFEVSEETKTASKKFVQASNKDASSLYKLWQDGVRDGSEDFDIQKTIESANLTSREISRLKALGFVKGDMEHVSFTDRGKRLLVTMTLSEPNRFQLKSERKPYSEILASINKKRTKTGGRITYADDNSNHLDLSK
jgi:hypothetical protein